MSDKQGSTSSPATYVHEPPTKITEILWHLGPGLIIAGSIVGSGELIATTTTGAQAGFWLLWLIVIGCVIKVFVQVEMGRYAVVSGQSSMATLEEVPGPRWSGRGNWVIWYWLLMFVGIMGQSGGIVGGVGQALAISVPITAEGAKYNEIVNVQTQRSIKQAELVSATESSARDTLRGDDEARLRREIAALGRSIDELGNKPDQVYDDRIWATMVTVVTALVLVFGRYRLIQTFSTLMVVCFTVVTIINLVMLQGHDAWHVRWQDIVDGMSFRLPPSSSHIKKTALATALATFGIIGVGASELVAYPYWCLEKGYARFTGPCNESEPWARRARGWMRVMRWDAWCSMLVYTFATIAFYLLGAAILGRTGLHPSGQEMVRILGAMYEPVFGQWAQWLFLFGAFAVLYSTFFVGSAGHARVLPDALRLIGVLDKDDASYRQWVRRFSAVIPFLGLSVYIFIPKPVGLVLFGAVMQAAMLPMLAGAALYFRYRRCDSRIVPGRLWDAFLWISGIGMTIAGVWAAWEKLASLFVG